MKLLRHGPNDPVIMPRSSEKTDWEVELGVIIGTKAKYVTKSETLTHVAGYCVINDVSYLSQFMTLHPGDVILTGTPPGVGMGMKPPRYLKAGDVVALGIEGLGQQRQDVIADSPCS